MTAPARISERDLKPSLLDAEAGPALPIAPEQSEAIVAGALKRVSAELSNAAHDEASDSQRTAGSGPRRLARVIKLRRPRLWVAGVVLAGSAAAAVGHQQLVGWAPSSTPMQAPEQAPADIPVKHASTASQPALASPQPSAAVPQRAEPSEVDVEGATDQQYTATNEIAPPSTTQVRRTAQRSANVTTPRQTTPAAPKQAEDLLAKANVERRAGRYSAALEIYQSVMRQFPSSRQAEVARLAAASLRLEHLDDVDGAEALYDQGARGGSMSAEALYGLAEAKRRRGDRDGERAVLRRLVDEHSESPLSRSAGKRLESLSR